MSQNRRIGIEMNVTVIINSSKETTRIGMEQGMAARKTE